MKTYPFPTALEIYHDLQRLESVKRFGKWADVLALESEVGSKEEARAKAIKCTDYRKTRCYSCTGCSNWAATTHGKPGNGHECAVNIAEYRARPRCADCNRPRHLSPRGKCGPCAAKHQHPYEEWCPCSDCQKVEAATEGHPSGCFCHPCDAVRFAAGFHWKPANSFGPEGVTCDDCYQHADTPEARAAHRCL
jgi:hypothetical protein